MARGNRRKGVVPCDSDDAGQYPRDTRPRLPVRRGRCFTHKMNVLIFPENLYTYHQKRRAPRRTPLYRLASKGPERRSAVLPNSTAAFYQRPSVLVGNGARLNCRALVELQNTSARPDLIPARPRFTPRTVGTRHRACEICLRMSIHAARRTLNLNRPVRVGYRPLQEPAALQSGAELCPFRGTERDVVILAWGARISQDQPVANRPRLSESP